MLKNNKSFFIGALVFISIEFVFAFLIHLSTINYGVATAGSILVALVFAVLFALKDRLSYLMVIALAFTFIADVFLTEFVVWEHKQLFSVLAFIVVQACYFLRIYYNQIDKRQKLIHLSVRILVTVLAVVVTIIVLKDRVNALAIASLFYYANLLINVIFGFIQFRKSPCFALGLLFFACCDLFIGLDVMQGLFLKVPENSIIYILTHTGVNIAWAFYLPSQVLLVLSERFYK